ncbi:MAG: GNAT family N-acetyltransferase [Bacillota bacterium]
MPGDRIDVKEVSITSEDASGLLGELNAALTRITGASGEASFAAEDVADARGVFVIAYVNGEALGCGALRPLSERTAEIKRVYARPNAIGIGSAIVKALEEKARILGYTELVLETRKVNAAAVAFYMKLGYLPCPNFGKYVGREDAVCMSKWISYKAK